MQHLRVPGVVLLLLVFSAAASAGVVTLTFDELPLQPVNGLKYQGVTFGFTISGVPSHDAFYHGTGPGQITYVKDPSLEGNALGALTISFDIPVHEFSLGYAIAATVADSSAVTLNIFDPSGASLLSTALAGNPLPTFDEGTVTVASGSQNIKRLVLTFDSAKAPRFAIDNLTYDNYATPPYVSGCGPHTVHSHASQPHHGQHGHSLGPDCPPHPAGHSAGLTPEAEEGLFATLQGPGDPAPTVVAALNEDGSFNGDAPASAVGGFARRGSVLQLYGSPWGLWLDSQSARPAWSGGIQHTSSLPEVKVGGVPAKVLFSGLAPGLAGVWQINVLVPQDAPAGRAIPISLTYEGREVQSIAIGIDDRPLER